jgi:hypothetical protein
MEALAEAVIIQVAALPQEPQILGTMEVAEQLEDFDCPVCWNTITEGEKKVQTSCSHKLCADCVPKLQCLPGLTTCVSCPMCRTRLQKFAVPEVPLRKVPLNKIRQRLQRQNQIVANYQYQITNTPNTINYYMRRMQEAILNQENAHRELGPSLIHQAALQEEVNMRARPRQQNNSVEPLV